MNKKAANAPYSQSLGIIDTDQFTKMQSIMAKLNEQARYEALYNLLVLMKQMDEKEENK